MNAACYVARQRSLVISTTVHRNQKSNVGLRPAVAITAEGITPEILGLVDLSAEFSPVIAISGGRLEDAVTVRPWGFYPNGELPEKFEVMHGRFNAPVDRESLKVMRARYLLARDAYYGRTLHHLIPH